MIRTDLYTRRKLLGNGDDGRRCRDAHIEGKTIEESQVFHPESWLHKIQPYQVPLIPSSRGHNYAMTYLRLIPGTASQVRPTTNNSTALRPFPPCVGTINIVQFPPDLSHYRTERPHLSRLATPFYLSLYSCVPLAMRSGPRRVPFARDFRLEARRGTKGSVLQRGRGVSAGLLLPVPSCRVSLSLGSGRAYPRVPWTPLPRLRLGGKEEERMRSTSEIGYMKVLAYGSRTKHSITAKSWIPSLIKIKAPLWASRSSAGKARIPGITSPVPSRNSPCGVNKHRLYLDGVRPCHHHQACALFFSPLSVREHRYSSPPLIITFHLQAVQSLPSQFCFCALR